MQVNQQVTNPSVHAQSNVKGQKSPEKQAENQASHSISTPNHIDTKDKKIICCPPGKPQFPSIDLFKPLNSPKELINNLRSAEGQDRDKLLLNFQKDLDGMSRSDLRSARDYLGHLMADDKNNDDPFLGLLLRAVNKELDSRSFETDIIKPSPWPPQPSPWPPRPMPMPQPWIVDTSTIEDLIQQNQFHNKLK